MRSEASSLAPTGRALSVLTVVGTAAPPGRLAAALATMAEVFAAVPGVGESQLLDLSANTPESCDGRKPGEYGPATRAAVDAALAADAVVLGSPVYRATYTGVLKNYLDLLPVAALRDKAVGIVAMGASDHHYLGVDTAMRSVLAWFGALLAPTSVFLTGSSFDERRELGEGAREELADLAATVLALAGASETYGPVPLAARGAGPKRDERSEG